jgi:hypothetical protein
LKNIVDYVNNTKGTSLTAADLSFGTPELVDPSVLTLFHPTRRNTKVEVEFQGNLQIPAFELSAFYNRLHLSRLFAMHSYFIPRTTETTIHQLLPKISEIIKFTLTEADVYDGEFAEDGSFTMYARNESYGVFGSVILSVANDPAPPWFTHTPRYYVVAGSQSLQEDTLTIEQAVDESIYVGVYADGAQKSIFHEFSDLSDLTFEGGFVYAVPPLSREFTRVVPSYLNFPLVRQYVGTTAYGLKIEAEMEETEDSTTRRRSFQQVPYDLADEYDFIPAYYLVWLRFSHPDFDRPISFLYRKD